MENDLLANISKIHTTDLGIIRIKKNLELETNDIVGWCKNKIKNADNIVRNGKNWYVYKNGGINDPDYCVLKFTAKNGRYYYWYKTDIFELS